MNVTVMISRVREGFEDLPLPSYASIGAAGMDVRAAIDEPIVLEPGARAAVPTGLAIALPSGYECQVRARSGLALRNGIAIVNGPGTIDEDYRGEIAIILINHGEEAFHIERGDRIAQLVVAQYDHVIWEDVTMLSETERGKGGFGSTGRG